MSSVIGLTLGGLYQDYRIAYVNLGKMLYYSLPFIVASLWAFLAIADETRPASSKMPFRKLAWAFYITGFIFIMWLAAMASRTELLPEGFILAIGPTETVVFELLSSLIIFIGFYVGRNPGKTLTIIAASVLILGVLLMPAGIYQTSNVLKTGVVSLEQRSSNKMIALSLNQAQQVVFNLQSLTGESRFSYYLMTEEQFNNANKTGNFFTAPSLLQNAYVNQKSFSATIQKTGDYVLFVQSDYLLAQNVTYTVTVYDTVAWLGFVGFWFVIVGTAALGSYVVATKDDVKTEQASKVTT